MRRVLLVLILAVLAGGGALVRAPALSAQPAIAVQIGKLALSKVADWRAAPCGGQPAWPGDTCGGLFVSNNAGGELRLADGAQQAEYTSAISTTAFLYNAVGATWQADIPAGTSLTLEIRGGTSPKDEDLTPWQPLVPGDAQSQDDGAQALESVRPFPAGMAVLQLRATFRSTVANASPVLGALTLHYINATAGPSRLSEQQRVPAPYGPATLSPPPALLLRDAWGAPASSAPVVRQRPRGIILHQIGSDDVVSTPPFLRALDAYDTQVLGWDDLPFHFIVDRDGAIYVGRNGGPSAAAERFSGGDAAIHVALIGATLPSGQQQAALIQLLAWLGQAYDIAPLGTHAVAAKGAAPSSRPNIAAHAEAVPSAADPSADLRGQLDQLRQAADQATVRARWYFAEGNVLNFAERLSVLNPGAAAASVRFNLLRQPGPAVVRDASVAAGGRASLVVNDLFNDTSEVPAIVESNGPLIAERFLDFGSDISSGPGVRQPSRVWYFAEGSTEGDSKTYLVLFNPQAVRVKASVTYMQGDGATAIQSVEVAPLARTVVTVGDQLPGSSFGMRVIAAEPIVAERTMIFGPGSGATTGGFDTAPGTPLLSRQWYFAEGTTQPPFTMTILVLNPNAQPANVAVKFLTDSGTSLVRKYAIPPATRLSIPVNEVVPELGIATTVTADRPVAVERALTWRGGRAGTAGLGATSPAYTWRFADGRTSDNVQEYLLLSNPGSNQARVAVEFVLADGKTSTQTVIMPKESRYTMPVHELYPGQVAIAATVRSTQPIVAERSLYAGAPAAESNKGGATTLGIAEELP
ncbi:peptidoglycan recognition family protein [Kouleothrix sp.]|uniref:peptidoglycan recognition protein family protein n=1 Tax=Kouleothrix sp. TaxID=2779161 RepID=UPI00391D74F0